MSSARSGVSIAIRPILLPPNKHNPGRKQPYSDKPRGRRALDGHPEPAVVIDQQDVPS